MTPTIDPITAAVRYQRQLFAIYDEIFRRGTGDSAEAFREMNEFANSTEDRADDVVRCTLSAIADSWPELSQLYDEGADHYSRLRQIGGMKLVIGGTRHVLETQFNAIRKMVLYADTILLPDPVFPWLVQSRKQERFRFPMLLRNLRWLLLLKPLIDADLPVVPLIVFPSFELELESDDQDTKNGIASLFVDLLSSLFEIEFSSADDIASFARLETDRWISLVDQHGLFIPYGQETSTPFVNGVEAHMRELRLLRSDEMLNQIGQHDPRVILPFISIMERVAPLYHMIENANELRAQPMMIFGSHWYFF